MDVDTKSGEVRTSRDGLASWLPVLGVGILALLTLRRPESSPVTGRAGQSSSLPNHRDPITNREGRGAKTPSEIPAQGWKDILWRVYGDFTRHRILAVAAGVTFYGLLALFPAVASFVSLYGLFADARTINDQVASLNGILPSGALDILTEQVKHIVSKPRGTLSFALIASLAVSIWSANAGMKAVFDALNIVYDEDEKRGFFKLNLQSLLFTLGAIVFLMLAIGGVVVVPIVLNFVGLGNAGTWLLNVARWPLLLVATALGLAVLYRYGPSRTNARWRWITWGSGLASVLWLATSALFSWYVSSFGTYNETYGSLGAAIGFMTWIWLSTTVVLICADLDAETEHQAEGATTGDAGKKTGIR